MVPFSVITDPQSGPLLDYHYHPQVESQAEVSTTPPAAPQTQAPDVFAGAGFTDKREAVKWAYNEVAKALEDENPSYKATYVPARKVALALGKRLGIKQTDANKLLRDTIAQLFAEGNAKGISTGDTRIPAQSIGNGIGSIMFNEDYLGHGYEPATPAAVQETTSPKDQQLMYMHAGIMPKWVQDVVDKYMRTGLAELFHQYPGMPKEDVMKVQGIFMGQLRSTLEDVVSDYTAIMRKVNPEHDVNIDREIAYQIDEGKFTNDEIGRAAQDFRDLIAKYTAGESLAGKVLPALRTAERENYIHRIPKDYTGTEPVGWAQYKASRTPERNFRKPSIGGAAKRRAIENTMRNVDADFMKNFGKPFYEHNLNKLIYRRLEDSVNAQFIHKLIDDLLAKYTPDVPEHLQVPFEHASAKLTGLYNDKNELIQRLQGLRNVLQKNPQDAASEQARKEAATKLKAVEGQLEGVKSEYVQARDARKAWIEENYPHGYVTKLQPGTSIQDMAMRLGENKGAARLFSYMPERLTKALTLTKEALDKLRAGVPLEITPENQNQFITTMGRTVPSSHNFVVPLWMHRFLESGIRNNIDTDLAHRMNHFLNLVDKWNSLVRRLVVTSPVWHPLNMLFELGREPAAFRRIGEAVDALRTKSDIYDRARKAGIFPNMGNLRGRWTEKDKMLDALVANEQHNWRTWEYWRGIYRSQRITHTPFGAALETFLLHPSQALTWKTDAVLRMALFIHNAAKGMPDLENAQAVGDILHLYGRLSPVEREVFSRFFMFYDWMKHVVFEIPTSLVKRPLPSLVYLATVLAALDYSHVRTDGKHLWEEDTPLHAVSIVLGKDAKGNVTYLNPHIPALEPFVIGWEIIKGAPEYFFYRAVPGVRGPIGALAGYYNPFATADKKIPIAHKDLRPGVETVPLWTPVGYSTGKSAFGNFQVSPQRAYWAQAMLNPVSGWLQSIYTKGETPLQKLSRYLGLGYISQANPSATAYENLKTANLVDQNTRTYVLGRGAVESLIEGNAKPLYEAVRQLETMPNPIRVSQKEFADALNSPKNISRAINIMLKETNDPVRIEKLKAIQRQVDTRLLIQQLKSLRGNTTPQDFQKYVKSLSTTK